MEVKKMQIGRFLSRNNSAERHSCSPIWSHCSSSAYNAARNILPEHSTCPIC